MSTIGILGGMGPRATVEFEQRLLEKLSGSDQQLPTIVTINDGSIPDRSAYLLGKGIDPLPRISRNALQLQALGTDLICIPCNTACAPAILGRLQPRLRIPVINLPMQVVSEASRRGARSLYLLATDGTIQAKIYQQLCFEAGIICRLPSPKYQRLVQQIIAKVKTGQMIAARSAAREVQSFLGKNQSQAVILGCTELPAVAAELLPSGMDSLDSLDILAECAARYTKVKQGVEP